MQQEERSERSKDRPGPDPERIKIADDWEAAVSKALHKKRPAGGWPKPEKEEKGERKD